jgi:hypothetical protein
MKYNRADIGSAMRAAKHTAAITGTTRYIMATAFGLTIEKSPVVWQDFVKVLPSGETEQHLRKFGA